MYQQIVLSHGRLWADQSTTQTQLRKVAQLASQVNMGSSAYRENTAFSDGLNASLSEHYIEHYIEHSLNTTLSTTLNTTFVFLVKTMSTNRLNLERS